MKRTHKKRQKRRFYASRTPAARTRESTPGVIYYDRLLGRLMIRPISQAEYEQGVQEVERRIALRRAMS